MRNEKEALHKSFKSLRRLMGIEPEEEEEAASVIMEATAEGNMEVSFATARPDFTFTSLRKLVDERASFCMPSSSSSSSSKKNASRKPRVIKTSRGVYYDSDREEEDDDDDDLLFVDRNLPSSPSLFRGGASPPISPILKTTDSDDAKISRSILPELEATEKPSNVINNNIDTVEESEEDDDEEDNDSHVQEQSPPATPTPRSSDDDKQQKKSSRGSSSSLRTILCVFLAIFLLAVGGFFGRLYQLNKLDHFVAQVKDGTMDTDEFKLIATEVTGTQH
ncbi:MAG: hypothetical protein SGARI_007363, partial [Bacillariaceae sp.]